MNEFVRGKRGVTAENAIMLAALTGTSPELWMNLQAQYDLWHALKEVGRPKIEPLVVSR
jgi:addiction module HigA family antidote